MNKIVTQAKAEFDQAQERLIHVFATTPDDKINSALSPTSRTPVQLVAHVAMGTAITQSVLQADPFPYKNIAEYDAATRVQEKEYTTRAQALSLLEQTRTEYFAWIDSLTPEQLTARVDTLFGPMDRVSTIAGLANHMRYHTAQIEYLQTVWGDTDWHL